MLGKMETKFRMPKQSELKNFMYGVFITVISLLGLATTLKQTFYTNLTAPFTGKTISKDTTKISIESTTDNVNVDKPTLDEYLGNQICTGCSRHCILDAIRCSTGTSYVNEATNKYNDLYNETATVNADTTLFDYIYFMGFIVAGTHYIMKIKKNKNEQ